MHPQAEITDEIGMGIGHLQVVHPPTHGQVAPRALGKVQGIRMIVSFLFIIDQHIGDTIAI